MSRRETFYACAFSLGGEDWELVVRAWNARGAREHIATDLRAAGLPSPSKIAVRPLSRPLYLAAAIEVPASTLS